jgi:hypothetical protein
MNYLGLVKQIGLDRLVAFLVRVAGAVAGAVVKLVVQRKRSRGRAERQEVPPPEGVRVELTVVSISTETISVREVGNGGEAP